MERIRGFGFRLVPTICALTFLALAGLGVGCSSDDNNPPPANPTNFHGTYTDPAGPGTITLTQAAAATSASILGGGSNPIPIVGTLALAGSGSLPLDGTYFIDTGVMTFSSNDDAYNFTGDVANGIATGTSSGPDGAGAFVLFAGGTPSNVTVYCGSATCTSPPTCDAAVFFDMALAGSTAIVTADVDGTFIPAVGTVNGSSVDFHITTGEANITIHGTISGSTISGTWVDTVSGNSGTFAGSTAECTAARRRR
jgi:hypothetical protein